MSAAQNWLSTETTVEADIYLAACDVPGIQKLLPEAWRKFPQFEAIHQLEAVPVATVQLRYDGWVTELNDEHNMAPLLLPAAANYSKLQ